MHEVKLASCGTSFRHGGNRDKEAAPMRRGSPRGQLGLPRVICGAAEGQRRRCADARVGSTLAGPACRPQAAGGARGERASAPLCIYAYV
jgi:hypothetical protein